VSDESLLQSSSADVCQTPSHGHTDTTDKSDHPLNQTEQFLKSGQIHPYVILQFITLHYIEFKVKNAIALQTLYRHYSDLETIETTPKIN